MEPEFFDTRDSKEDGIALLGAVRAMADFIEDEGLEERFAKYLDKHAHEHGTRVDKGLLQISDGSSGNLRGRVSPR
jgi:hypothetical protein